MTTFGKVLLAESNRASWVLLENLLSAHFEVKQVSDGYEAVKELTGGSYDAVILALDLPLLCGENLLRVIHNMKQRVLAYVITDDATIETEKRVRGIGVDGYFLKPLETGRMLDILKTSIEYEHKTTARYTQGGIK